VMDMEAGMEHFSRGTIGTPDLLLVVSDPGARGIRTARRIHDLAVTLGIPKEKIFFVINRAGSVTPEKALRATAAGVAGGARPGTGAGGGSDEPYLDLSRILASVPDDPGVEKADLEARPIVSLPDGSPAKQAVRALAERVRSLCEG